MFKRLRDNLFGRGETQPETEAQPEAEVETQPETGPTAQPVATAPAPSQPQGAVGTLTPETPATYTSPTTPQAPAEPTSAPAAAPAAPPATTAPKAPRSPAAGAAPGIDTPSAPPPPAADRVVEAQRPTTQPSRPATQATVPPTAPAAAPATSTIVSAPAQPPKRPATPVAANVAPSIAPSVAPNPAPSAPLLPAEEAEEEEEEEGTEEEQGGRRGGFFRNPFKLGLGKTRQFFGQMNTALEEADEITDELWDELEETLITGDVGVQTTERLLDTLRERVQAEHLERGSELRDALKEELEILLGEPEPLVYSETSPITVLLVVGVNGVGKTTSIAKLANQLKRQKHRVMLAAGDTFRAAATEQLKLWGDRVGVPVVAHQHGADPGAVVYDAMQAAQARNTGVLIVDTAGRLHTKYNLMEELKKIVRVLQKYDPEAPHEVLLVVDATTGQNGFLQAKQFVKDAGVSGVILTKLDGTARGGIAFAIASELGLPIKYVGTGERVQDFAPFDAGEFVDALFDED